MQRYLKSHHLGQQSIDIDPTPQAMADEEEFNGSGSSDCSDDYSDGHGEIDESVMLEMTKLEDTFNMMGRKFRMIDRIGEGVSVLNFAIVASL